MVDTARRSFITGIPAGVVGTAAVLAASPKPPILPELEWTDHPAAVVVRADVFHVLPVWQQDQIKAWLRTHSLVVENVSEVGFDPNGYAYVKWSRIVGGEMTFGSLELNGSPQYIQEHWLLNR